MLPSRCGLNGSSLDVSIISDRVVLHSCQYKTQALRKTCSATTPGARECTSRLELCSLRHILAPCFTFGPEAACADAARQEQKPPGLGLRDLLPIGRRDHRSVRPDAGQW